ncbi:MAG: hypothetical protein K2X32_10630, partial [Phycisphaerales bacterium]|nr:hypothetical protein [Phycisphaerales bacterium]
MCTTTTPSGRLAASSPIIRAVFAVSAALVLALISPIARGSGPLISELVEREDLRRAIASTTSADLESSIALTPAQVDSSRLLIDGARTELERVINRHLRQTRAGCSYDELKASEASVTEAAPKIERQLLDDLRLLLTPDQLVGFDRFERARRRVLIRTEE